MSELGKKIILVFLLGMSMISNAKTIVLIGNPRSLTTAFTRYFINRGDFKVFHEPITLHHYSKYPASGIKSPFAKNHDADMILREIYENNQNSSIFIKEIASNLYDSKYLEKLLKQPDVYVVFLIRAPEQAVLSHYKLFKKDGSFGFNTPENQTDYAKMSSIFYKLKNNLKIQPILIDAEDLANDSSRVISKLCNMLDISYDPEKLKWESNPELYKAVDTWMKEVAYSTGFSLGDKRHSIKDNDFSLEEREFLTRLINHDRFIYEELIQYKI